MAESYQLNFDESIKLLKKHSIEVPSYSIIRSSKEATSISKKIGYPQAMKILSDDVIHKTDMGGVITNILDQKQAKESYDRIIINIKSKVPDAKIDGILTQKMFSGTEIIIGMKRDSQFGPVILFGLGGVFVEIMKDVSMGIAPINKKQAIEMINSIKGISLLKGARGSKPANIDKIADLILKVSALSIKEEDVKEIDFNPVFIDGDKMNIVDIRIIK